MAEKIIKVSGDLTSDEKFSEALKAIKKKGYISSHRSGDTGVGKTLEDELGIEENSVQAADLGTVDIVNITLHIFSKIASSDENPHSHVA